MTQVPSTDLPVSTWTAADLVARFGAIPLERVRFDPFPGEATIEDALRIEDEEGRLYELVDGVLLEKTVGNYESYLAIEIAVVLRVFVGEHKLGMVLGADGRFRLFGGQLRMPDACFIAAHRLKGHDWRRQRVAPFPPDLAIEVISAGNTKQEMDQKLKDYFGFGVRLVWCVYPVTQTVAVYTAVDQHTELTIDETLTGGDVLPGFRLPLSKLFGEPPFDEED